MGLGKCQPSVCCCVLVSTMFKLLLGRMTGRLSKEAYQKVYREACGYQKLGLRRHDLLVEYPDVVEAIKRLPVVESEARDRRLQRAFDLDMKREVLPEEEWTKPDEDEEYLSPYIAEVMRERLEREAYRD